MNQSAEKITNLKTELYSFHIANGGKMVPFAGYDMPVQYSEGIIKEHQHVRSSAGIFDVSHMGQCSIFGNEKDYIALEQIVPIDLKSLRVNQSKYSVLIFVSSFHIIFFFAFASVFLKSNSFSIMYFSTSLPIAISGKLTFIVLNK